VSSFGCPGSPASADPAGVSQRRQIVHELLELIEALDRRLPRVERAGEASIALDAAALRALAVTRVAELTSQDTPDDILPSPGPIQGSGAPSP
jgi:hypothetical protein